MYLSNSEKYRSPAAIRIKKFSEPVVVPVILAYFLFLRPSLFHQAFSSLFIVFLFSLVYFFIKPSVLNKFSTKFCVFFIFVLLFLIVYSGVIDLMYGSYQSPFQSMVGYYIRMAIYFVTVAYFCSNVTKNKFSLLDKYLLYVVVAHCIFAAIMIINLDFKTFMYEVVSGYQPDHKLLSSYLFNIRNFGWSDELFFSGPVFLVFYYILFMSTKTNLFISFLGLIIVIFFSIISARLAIVAIPFAFMIRFGVCKSFLPIVVMITIFLFVYAFIEVPILGNFFEEFRYGGLRTLRILMDSHIHFLPDGLGVLIGSFEFIFANKMAPVNSDIGWLIVYNHGGLISLTLCLLMMWMICRYAFCDIKDAILAFLFLFILGIKGSIYNGNSIIALLLCFAFSGGYHKSIVSNLKFIKNEKHKHNYSNL